MRLVIEIPESDVQLIRELLELTQTCEFTSHGPLDMKRLARMLLEDVALTVRRPGSWEGANMAQVLRSHGYSV